MRNTMNAILGLATALFFCACSAEERLEGEGQGEASVSLCITLPEDMMSRAYSDGLTATYLTYGVYRVDDGELTLIMSQNRVDMFKERATTVDLQLARGHSYKLFFFADAGSDCPYTIDLDNHTLTMDYADAASGTAVTLDGNNEKRDVFYATTSLTNFSEPMSGTLELYRPLAQLNYGTDDFTADVITAAGGESVFEYSVQLPAGLPTKLDLLTGEASAETTTTVTFTAKGVPSEDDGTFPVTGYEYVSMNYLLAGLGDATKTVLSSDAVVFTMHDTNEKFGDDIVCEVNNVPLQRNFRTNIYGSLATAPASYSLLVCEAYDGGYVYDGGVCYRTCSTEEEMLSLLAEGENVMLLSDIELSSSLELTAAAVINLNDQELTITPSTTFQDLNEHEIQSGITTSEDLTLLNGKLSGEGALHVTGQATLTMSGVTMQTGTEESTTYMEVCLYYESSSTESTLTDCSFSAQSTGTRTEAIINDGTGTLTLSNCTLTVSSTYDNTYGLHTANSGTTVLNDCEISVSSTGTYVIGVYVSRASNVELNRCTVASTTTGEKGCWAICNNDTGSITADYCDLSCQGQKSFVYTVYQRSSGPIAVSNSTLSATATSTDDDATADYYHYFTDATTGTISFSNCTYTVTKGETTTTGTAEGVAES